VVISLDPTPPRGSARSPEGIDLLGALSLCADCLVQHGGHAQAAGLAIERDMIRDFTRNFTDACGRMGGVSEGPSLKVDACVDAGEIDEELVGELMMCAPFGVGNPEPVLALRGVTVTDARTVGSGHLKLSVSSGRGDFEAIGFNMADIMPAQSTVVDIAFTPQFNTWNGRTAIQLKIKDIAKSIRMS
jgi:single-stranded-DNA-specific exonuclease